MPKLVCHGCGRQVYTVAPLESLFAEERRCPRCGAYLSPERREEDRRRSARRVSPPEAPGPPLATGERREAQRRRGGRRTGDHDRGPA
jgi:DNA-directed RNA polymerase subunit RPC12/RpoP